MISSVKNKGLEKISHKKKNHHRGGIRTLLFGSLKLPPAKNRFFPSVFQGYSPLAVAHWENLDMFGCSRGLLIQVGVVYYFPSLSRDEICHVWFSKIRS